MRIQTAGQLKKLLKDVPDDIPVIGHESDHTYFPATVELTTALDEGHGSWGQDFGQEHTPEPEFGKRVPVLLIT